MQPVFVVVELVETGWTHHRVLLISVACSDAAHVEWIIRDAISIVINAIGTSWLHRVVDLAEITGACATRVVWIINVAIWSSSMRLVHLGVIGRCLLRRRRQTATNIFREIDHAILIVIFPLGTAVAGQIGLIERALLGTARIEWIIDQPIVVVINAVETGRRRFTGWRVSFVFIVGLLTANIVAIGKPIFIIVDAIGTTRRQAFRLNGQPHSATETEGVVDENKHRSGGDPLKLDGPAELILVATSATTKLAAIAGGPRVDRRALNRVRVIYADPQVGVVRILVHEDSFRPSTRFARACVCCATILSVGEH